MHIARLKLALFRSWKKLELEDLPKGPIALSGPNGAGKTNILEALSLLAPGRGLRRASPEAFARTQEALGWSVSAEAGGQELWTGNREHGSSRAVQIGGKAATQLELGRLVRMVWLTPNMDRLFIEGASGRRVFLDRITLSFTPDHAAVSLDYEKAMRERNRLLREGVRDPHWLNALEARMASAGERLIAARLATIDALMQAQESHISAFPQSRLLLVDADGAPFRPLPAAELALALEKGRPRDAAAGRTLIGPHRTDLATTYLTKDMPAGLCSTGEQKALLIGLILANARALLQSRGEAPVLLLDEVAAHLDPERRALLFDEICVLGAQAFMTGTHAGLFEAFGKRAAHFAVSEQNSQSIIM